MKKFFILAVVAILLALYVMIFRYEDIPEIGRRRSHRNPLVPLMFLPGGIFWMISRACQNQRTSRVDGVILPKDKVDKKKKYKWD